MVFTQTAISRNMEKMKLLRPSKYLLPGAQIMLLMIASKWKDNLPGLLVLQFQSIKVQSKAKICWSCLIVRHIIFKTFRYLILRKCSSLLTRPHRLITKNLYIASLDHRIVSDNSLQLMTRCTGEFFTDFWMSQKQIMIGDFSLPLVVLSICWFLYSLFSLFYPFAKLFYNHYTFLAHIPLQCFHNVCL